MLTRHLPYQSQPKCATGIALLWPLRPAVQLRCDWRLLHLPPCPADCPRWIFSARRRRLCCLPGHFQWNQQPVLIAEIKDDKWANKPHKRQRADAQMRQRYDQMLFNCPIPRLYELSLLGTSLRVYRGDKVTGEVTPDFFARPSAHRVLPPDFLEGEWDLDILSPEGLVKMQEIVAYIKAESANVVAYEVGTHLHNHFHSMTWGFSNRCRKLNPPLGSERQFIPSWLG